MENQDENGRRIQELRRFLGMDPANIPLACDLFDALVASGDIGQAVAVLVALPQEVQVDAGIRFRHAHGGLMQGRYADAKTLMAGLLEEGHDSMALWHDLAFAQLCMRETEAARTTVANAEERFGNCVELDIVVARIAMMEGEFGQALGRLDHVLELRPDHATALGLRALAMFDEGKTDIGFSAARACLATYPHQHEALLVAGTAALWRQDLDESEANFARALAVHPGSGRCLSGLGQVRMLQNRLEDAKQLLLQAVAAMPDHIGTWHSLAWASLLIGDVDTAEASYLHAYDLDRNFADSHGGLALIHVLQGRLAEGELTIRRALRLNPQCGTALYAKTLLLEAEGRGDEALQVLGQLVPAAGLPEGVDLAGFARALRARFQCPSH